MSFFNIFSNQLSEVIEWKNQDSEVLWYKHPSKRDEIMNASKLIVAPGQGCILVYEGKVENVLAEEGIYNLKTDNHPFLTTLSRLRQGFTSEHKVYIYFFRRALVVNQSWGTYNPVKYMDPRYEIPIELGANGTFAYRISNPEFFYNNIVANKDEVKSADIREIIVNKLPQEITTFLASSKYSYTDIDAQLSNIGTGLQGLLNKDFESLGLEINDFKILGTQFDEKTIARIGGIADITSQNKAAQEAGLSYTELEKLRALRDAARNPGGLAGIGAQLGAGIEIAKQYEAKKEEVLKENEQEGDFVQKLQKLNILLKEQIITQEEFDALKKQILSKI
ncbi:SPFH domain-containing protein [Chitinophaga sp. 212800010-3]|uniref:SPFH domain-containing protein n=1 Tax=unclassified Chitinophaga TaxID=2619133 RepID=UPI002DF3B0E6|nr:Band-7-1 domain-containing protein [Chitinophaga sp. 212800010-3]